MEFELVETYTSPLCCNALQRMPSRAASGGVVAGGCLAPSSQYLVGMYELVQPPQEEKQEEAMAVMEDDDDEEAEEQKAPPAQRIGSTCGFSLENQSSIQTSWSHGIAKMAGGVFDLQVESWSKLGGFNLNKAMKPEDNDQGEEEEADVTVITCSDGFLRFASPATGELLHEVQVNTDVLTSTCVPQHGCSPGTVLTTQQGGQLTLFDLERRVATNQWAGHDFDSWCCSSLVSTVGTRTAAADGSPSGGGTPSAWSCVTGSDDGVVKAWDLRMGTEMAVWSKRHSAGVVSLVPLPLCGAGGLSTENGFLLGSYDENIYLYDRRSLRRAVSEVNVQGGAWRVRPELNPASVAKGSSSEDVFLAVAAMQSGGVLLTLQADGTFDEIARTPVEGESRGPATTADALIYDAWYDTHAQELVTCDFYAKSVQRWKLPKEDVEKS